MADADGHWLPRLAYRHNPKTSLGKNRTLPLTKPVAVRQNQSTISTKRFPEEALAHTGAVESVNVTRQGVLNPGRQFSTNDDTAKWPLALPRRCGVGHRYEESNNYRQIYTDGRQLPVDPQPTWTGYSVGRWEGDTLVVDATGFNDQGWLDAMGHPQSEGLRIRERFHRRDFGHMDLELTIDDPKTYTKPFTLKATEVLLPDSDVLEYVCTENEKDRAHLGKQ